MKSFLCRRLPLLLLVMAMLCLNSSCQLLGPAASLLSAPLSMLGSALSTVTANPLGTAAAAAAL